MLIQGIFFSLSGENLPVILLNLRKCWIGTVLEAGFEKNTCGTRRRKCFASQDSSEPAKFYSLTQPVSLLTLAIAKLIRLLVLYRIQEERGITFYHFCSAYHSAEHIPIAYLCRDGFVAANFLIKL